MSGDVDAFLASFFGPGNDLSVDELRSSHPDLARWLEDCIAAVRADPGAANVLPRRVGTATTWYGLAHSARQLRELAERLTAFVGPTYARFEYRAVTGPDPIDSSVAQFTAGHALMFYVLPGTQQQVRRAIELLSSVTAQQPQRTVAMARPLGRLLHEFDMAVLAAAESTSAALLAEIERSGQVSAENLLFLRVRRLGGLHRYGELLAMPQLATLLMMRRPAQVTAALFDAVYTTYLARFETTDDAAGAITEFSVAVLPKYPALFRSRQGLQTSSAIKTYLLYGIVAHPGDTLTRDQLLGAPDLTDDERRFLAHVDQHATRPSGAPATLADAEAEARRGNFDVAFIIARDAQTGVERAEVLLRCAVEMRTIEAVTTALAAMEDLTDADRTVLTSSRWQSALWEDVRSALTEPATERADEATEGKVAANDVVDSVTAVPRSWPEWFDRVVSDPHFDQAAAIAEHGSFEWATAQLTADASTDIHATLNADLDARALRAIRNAIPSFLAFLERCGDLGRHRELFDDVATLLFMTEGIGVADVQVLIGIIGILLETGVTTTHYRRLVTDFLELWKDIDSPAQLDNGIELLDVLLTYSAPDPGAREEFFHALAGTVARWRDRMRPAQWDVVVDLAHEMGSAATISSLRTDTAADAQGSESLGRDSLQGKTVAIYTLTDQAALRAKEFLNRHFDDVNIELTNDHVATDRLGHLAHTADVFVVATRSAKHSATNHIQAQRPARLPIAFAGGKGSTSLIRAVLAHVT